ncbi:hypothetical protein AAON49_11105 [Pseudotenacibaculum sp. MALMAid0570]|uniref:hypothetical protein n=1 Tax=Pseudotenacibaculum sp. MALMAid0570 TaxID=3143938 RepID=UPI0032DF89C4
MGKLLKFLVEEFGFLFEDYPLESGIVLILIASFSIYLLRNRVFYIKNRVPILYFFLNLRTLLYIVGIIGVSQVLKGLNIYNSILKDFIEGMEVFEKEYPIILGSLITSIGIYFIYDKFKIADEEIEELESDLNKYKFWVFTILIILIGVLMIYRNI